MAWRIAFSLLALVLLSLPGWAQVAGIASDRMLLIDGKRTFLIGLYENPSDDAILRQVADAGFNLVQVSNDAAALDRLRKHGLHGWTNTGACIDLSEDRSQREEQIRKMVAAIGAHPALLAWEVPDEALWNCWCGAMDWRTGAEPKQQRARIDALTDAALAERLRAQRAEADRLFARADFARFDDLVDDLWRKLGVEPPQPGLRVSLSQQRADRMCAGMRDGHALLKQLDPNHPVWMNHAPRNQVRQLAAFSAAADIVGCDIYPVPQYVSGHSDLVDRSLASTGAYTARMQDAAPGKPVWMVLQGFGWADLEKEATPESREKRRRPTFEESRFMAYDAIIRGARGILYWGTASIEKDSTLWKDLLKLARELADLQPVWSAPDAEVQPKVDVAPSWGSLEFGVRALAKQVGDEPWFLVVNESADPLRYSLDGVAASEGAVYRDPADAREATVLDRKLALGISGHGVQILRPGAAK
jgi:hypothetical protein